MEERILEYIEEITGLNAPDEKLDIIKGKIGDILDIMGYEQKQETETVQESRPDPIKDGIDNELIKYLEELSRLRLTEEEEEKAKEDLTKILGYINMLNSIDTTDAQPMSHPFAFTNNFRKDEVKASTDRELILKNAPQQKDGCFKVPKTVE